jgi:hypothetical protein
MRYGKARYGTVSNFSKLDRTLNWIEPSFIRRGVTRQRTLKCASLASPRRLSTKCPTSAFLISVPQSHKSRKSSRARFSTLFSCAIRRAALAWYCAIKNVHFRWYYTCACRGRCTVMASVCLPRNHTEREYSDFGAVVCR